MTYPITFLNFRVWGILFLIHLLEFMFVRAIQCRHNTVNIKSQHVIQFKKGRVISS